MVQASSRGASGEHRRARIASELQSAGFLSVTSLAERLSVSAMTIRRDLRVLAEAGELRVVHGGASLPHPTLRGADFSSRGRQQHDAKQRIAARALQLIPPGAAIAIDAGTTTFEMALGLEPDFAGTLITNSVPVLQVALGLPNCRVLGAGGELLAASQAFVGPRSVDTLSGLHADLAFMGAAAVGPRGVFVATDLERPTKLATMASAARIVLLADASKFVSTAPCLLTGLDRVDLLITDAEPPPEMAEALVEHAVDVLLA